jgi:hypothetical protein
MGTPDRSESPEDLVKVGLAEKTSVKYGNNTKTLLRRRDAQIGGRPQFLTRQIL